jgi:Protein of unknown function (DUF2516)
MALDVLQFVIAYGSIALITWAFVDASRFRVEAYRNVATIPRRVWLGLFVFGFGMSLWLGTYQMADPLSPRNLMWAATMTTVGIYFYDLRPRLVRAQRIEP